MRKLSSIKDKCIVKIPFDDFFNSLNIDSLYKGENIRFNRAIELVLDVQSNSFCDYKGKRVHEEDGQLTEVSYVGKSALIPRIEFEFDDELGDINKIEDLILSRKRNKSKYIKNVVLKFEPETFASLVSSGREYTLANRRFRDAFESIHAFRLDSLVRSIEKIQHYATVNHYTHKNLNSLFGVSYSAFSDFKRRVLIPAQKEFNECDDMHVEFKEVKKGNKLDYIYFIITRKENRFLEGNYKTFDLAYYIAVQHFYFDDYIEGQVAESFIEHYEEIKYYTNKISTKGEYVYGGKGSKDLTLSAWEDEYHKALDRYEKLIIATTEDKKWFDDNGLKVCANKLCLIEIETGKVFEPYEELFNIHNPIKSYAY